MDTYVRLARSGHKDLARARLAKEDLADFELERVDLRKADLYSTNLTRAKLRHSNLSRANLDYTRLIDADMTFTNLEGAHFNGADLSGANLWGVKIDENTCFFQVKTEGAIGIIFFEMIGSRRDTLIVTFGKGMWFQTGCFYGSTRQFLYAVLAKHGFNRYGKEYYNAVFQASLRYVHDLFVHIRRK